MTTMGEWLTLENIDRLLDLPEEECGPEFGTPSRTTIALVLYDRVVALQAALVAAERERDRAWAVARCADAYLDCLAEFTDTAAGNLSDCCREYLQHLDAAVDAWRAALAGRE